MSSAGDMDSRNITDRKIMSKMEVLIDETSSTVWLSVLRQLWLTITINASQRSI